MADTPKKTSAPTRKTPANAGKAVVLTARQALQAADLATAKAPPTRKAPAALKPPVAKAVTAKPAVAKPTVEKAPAVPPVAEKTLPAPKPQAPVVMQEAKPEVAAALPSKPEVAALPDTLAPVETVEVVNSMLKETMPQTENAVQAVIAEGKNTMNDVIENTKKYTEEAKTRFQSAFAEMNEKAKVSVEKSTKTMEEMTELAKGNVEAMVESGKIAAKGMETMGQEAAEYSRLTFEKASAMMKSLAAVKSPTEFFQLQSEMLSSAFDAFAKESAKNSEAIIKLAGDVAQPLSSRMSVVTEKVKSLAA